MSPSHGQPLEDLEEEDETRGGSDCGSSGCDRLVYDDSKPISPSDFAGEETKCSNLKQEDGVTTVDTITAEQPGTLMYEEQQSQLVTTDSSPTFIRSFGVPMTEPQWQQVARMASVGRNLTFPNPLFPARTPSVPNIAPMKGDSDYTPTIVVQTASYNNNIKGANNVHLPNINCKGLMPDSTVPDLASPMSTVESVRTVRFESPVSPQRRTDIIDSSQPIISEQVPDSLIKLNCEHCGETFQYYVDRDIAAMSRSSYPQLHHQDLSGTADCCTVLSSTVRSRSQLDRHTAWKKCSSGRQSSSGQIKLPPRLSSSLSLTSTGFPTYMSPLSEDKMANRHKPLIISKTYDEHVGPQKNVKSLIKRFESMRPLIMARQTSSTSSSSSSCSNSSPPEKKGSVPVTGCFPVDYERCESSPPEFNSSSAQELSIKLGSASCRKEETEGRKNIFNLLFGAEDSASIKVESSRGTMHYQLGTMRNATETTGAVFEIRIKELNNHINNNNINSNQSEPLKIHNIETSACRTEVVLEQKLDTVEPRHSWDSTSQIVLSRGGQNFSDSDDRSNNLEDDTIIHSDRKINSLEILNCDGTSKNNGPLLCSAERCSTSHSIVTPPRAIELTTAKTTKCDDNMIVTEQQEHQQESFTIPRCDADSSSSSDEEDDDEKPRLMGSKELKGPLILRQGESVIEGLMRHEMSTATGTMTLRNGGSAASGTTILGRNDPTGRTGSDESDVSSEEWCGKASDEQLKHPTLRSLSNLTDPHKPSTDKSSDEDEMLSGEEADLRGGEEADLRGGEEADLRGGEETDLRGGEETVDLRGGRAADCREGRDRTCLDEKMRKAGSPGGSDEEDGFESASGEGGRLRHGESWRHSLGGAVAHKRSSTTGVLSRNMSTAAMLNDPAGTTTAHILLAHEAAEGARDKMPLPPEALMDAERRSSARGSIIIISRNGLSDKEEDDNNDNGLSDRKRDSFLQFRDNESAENFHTRLSRESELVDQRRQPKISTVSATPPIIKDLRRQHSLALVEKMRRKWHEDNRIGQQMATWDRMVKPLIHAAMTNTAKRALEDSQHHQQHQQRQQQQRAG